MNDVVRQQADAGIDVVSDGEQSKAGFFAYVAERLSGLEPDTIGVPDRSVWKGELDRFPEYYREYLGGKAQSMIRNPPLICTGPITYKGQAALQADIDNLQARSPPSTSWKAFMPSIAPQDPGRNAYYHRARRSWRRSPTPCARSTRRSSGRFILQIDDPWLTRLYHEDPYGLGPERHIDMLNHALRRHPAGKVRYHTCYGINEGPRIHDVPLLDLVPLLLRIKRRRIRSRRPIRATCTNGTCGNR